MATPAGFENKVAFIWKIADKLRGGSVKPRRRPATANQQRVVSVMHQMIWSLSTLDAFR